MTFQVHQFIECMREWDAVKNQGSFRPMWLKYHSWDYSIQRSTRHSGFCKFHRELCHEMSHHKLFAKIPSWLVVHETTLFQLLL